MNINLKLTRLNPFLIVYTILVSLIIFNACKKHDFGSQIRSDSRIITKFFEHNANIDTTVKAIIESIKRQNDKRNFAVRLTNTAGYPVWNKSKVSIKDEKKQVFIPFVLENGNQTNAVLIARLSGRDTLYHLLYGAAYKKYGFDKKVKDRWTAREIFTAFAIFDKEIFGHEKFTVKDDRLLGSENNDPNNAPANVIMKDSIAEQNARVARIHYFEHTVTWVTCGECNNWAKTMTDECCNATYYTDVVVFWYDDGVGGGIRGEWGWYPPEGGGGGGGEPCPGCNWDNTNPCEEQDPNQPQFPCDQDWRPTVNADIFDYYDEWGYKHFETWLVTPGDYGKIENWRQNNIDTAGLDSCVRKVLDKLLNSDNMIGKILGKMERSNAYPLNIEQFDIRIQVGSLPPDQYGLTYPGHFNPTTQIFTDTIVLKDSLVMFGTELGIAKVLIHELIHSYMKSIFHRFFYNSYTSNQIAWMNADTMFNIYIDTLLARHTRLALNNWITTNVEYDHNLMADKLINQMSDILADIDDNRNTDEQYWGMNWGGLWESTTMDRHWKDYPVWPPNNPAPSNDSTRGLKYALTLARLDSIWRWSTREYKGGPLAKGRPKIPGGCY